MATFGKRVQPKHRASPGDRKRASDPAPAGGSHAASVAAAPVAPIEPAPVEPAAIEPAPVDPAPVDPAPVELTPEDQAPVDPGPLAPPVPAPAAPELERQPAPQQPATQVSVSDPAPSSAPPGTLRVLVVDDNEDVRGLLRIAFARAGIEVVGSASDAREALAMAQHDRPAVILLDVNLPDVAGLDLLPQLREHCPQARVVMFSAQCSSQVTEVAMQRGAVGFVEKGVSMKSVVAHLHEVAQAPAEQVVEPFPLKVYP